MPERPPWKREEEEEEEEEEELDEVVRFGAPISSIASDNCRIT
jgi:hypothetical protein